MISPAESEGKSAMDAARCVDVSTPRLIMRHLLPNVFAILVTQVTLDIGYVVLSTAGLSFLGLGAQSPTPEWGAMITTACTFVRVVAVCYIS